MKERIERAASKPSLMGLALLIVYACLSLLMDPGGYLGTDTGAKVATLDRMSETGSWRPEVGYWAAEWDPDAEFHPLVFSQPNDRGDYVNVTTLPMLIAARPFYDLGGYRLALVLPIAGSIASAFAARSLARTVGREDDGDRAFWAIGLASPAAVYALDLWEHSLGLALMLWALRLLLETMRQPGAWRGLGAGALFGCAAAMRTEAIVVGFVAVGAACVVLTRRGLAKSVLVGTASIVGFLLPWSGNRQLEVVLGGRSRGARASSQAATIGDDIDVRIREAFQTWFGLPVGDLWTGVLCGLTVALSIAAGVFYLRRGESRIARIAVVAGVSLYFLALAGGGLGFVPGALMASPMVLLVVGLREWNRDARYLVVVSLVATTVIWATQYTGGAGPQWGGRYILGPTIALTTVGVVAVRSIPKQLTATVASMAVAISAFGVAWLAERSHEVDRFFEEMVERPEDVVIVTNGFLTREGGAAYDDRRWLSLGPEGSVSDAFDVAEQAGLETVGVLTSSQQRVLNSATARLVAIEPVEFLGVTLQYQIYRTA